MAGPRDSRGRFTGKGGGRPGGKPSRPGGGGGGRGGRGKPGVAFEFGEDSRGWQALKRTLESLRSGGSYVKAGVIGKPAAEAHASEDGPLTNAGLAAIHEFGTDTIPARPFILGTFELRRKKYLDLLKTTIVPAIYAARATSKMGLEVLGHMMAKDMRNRIVEGEGIPPPLAESTVKAKIRKGKWKGPDGGASDGAPRPLLDTGRMRNAITHAVVIQGGDE